METKKLRYLWQRVRTFVRSQTFIDCFAPRRNDRAIYCIHLSVKRLITACNVPKGQKRRWQRDGRRVEKVSWKFAVPYAAGYLYVQVFFRDGLTGEEINPGERFIWKASDKDGEGSAIVPWTADGRENKNPRPMLRGTIVRRVFPTLEKPLCLFEPASKPKSGSWGRPKLRIVELTGAPVFLPEMNIHNLPKARDVYGWDSWIWRRALWELARKIVWFLEVGKV